jgi:hypothetical protein
VNRREAGRVGETVRALLLRVAGAA